MNIKQTASKAQIKLAKKKAGKGKRHSKIFNSFKPLQAIAHIYER